MQQAVKPLGYPSGRVELSWGFSVMIPTNILQKEKNKKTNNNTTNLNQQIVFIYASVYF